MNNKIMQQKQAVSKLIGFLVPCRTEKGRFKGRLSLHSAGGVNVSIGNWRSSRISFDHAVSVLAGDIPYVDMRTQIQ